MTFIIGKPQAQGYACQTDRATGKILAETDTYTCNHARHVPNVGLVPCQRVIHVPLSGRFEDVADFCRGCGKVICAQCADQGKGACTTFMQAIERAEEEDARKAQRRRAMGL